MKVGFCGSCKRLVMSHFLYCPYCGVALGRGPGLGEALEEPFARIERRTRKSLVDGRIAELSARLDTIDLELESLLAERREG